MKKTYTIEDIRDAFKAGLSRGRWEYSNQRHDFDEPVCREGYIDDLEKEEVEEELVPITFYQIKNGPGWSIWCDVTGGNHYALNEGYSPKDTEIFYTTISNAKELRLV